MTPSTPPAGARLTDEQIADLLGIVEDDAAVGLTVSNRLDTAQLIAALRELQAHRAAARVSGGEAVERPCAHRLEFQIAEGRFKCIDCGERFLSQQPVPQPAAPCIECGHSSDRHQHPDPDCACCDTGKMKRLVPQPAAQEVAPLERLAQSWTVAADESDPERKSESWRATTLRDCARELRVSLSRVAPPAPSVDLEQPSNAPEVLRTAADVIEAHIEGVRAWDLRPELIPSDRFDEMKRLRGVKNDVLGLAALLEPKQSRCPECGDGRGIVYHGTYGDGELAEIAEPCRTCAQETPVPSVEDIERVVMEMRETAVGRVVNEKILLAFADGLDALIQKAKR